MNKLRSLSGLKTSWQIAFMGKRNWTFLTSHAVVFLHIVHTPDDTIRKIADEINLAERTVASILADLRDDGYITVRKRGKTNVYTLSSDLPMRHPSHAHYSVRDFFAPLEAMEESSYHPNSHLPHYRRRFL